MSWFSELNTVEKRTFYSAFGGWALDALDFMVFTFVIASLMTLWHIDKGSVGLLSTVTLLFSSIGGWGAGILADRYGRVRLLQISILWFSICTVLIGFAQNFEQLFVLRALQGLGFGGEWAVGSVLIGEMVRAQHRGKAVGIVQSGWAIGWGAAALLYTLSFSLLPEDIAWRSLFWIGIVPALLVLYIRKYVPEPEVFLRTKKHQSETGNSVPFWHIFSPSLLRTTLLSALLCMGVQGGYYAITTWLPAYLKLEKGLSVFGTGSYLMVVIIGSFFGYVCGAFLSDRLGRRPNFIIFAVLSAISVVCYMQLNLTNTQMLFLGFPLGFAASGIYSGMGAFLTELYPSAVRANGQAFSYNFGRAVGALFPGLVGFISAKYSLGTAIAIFAGGAYCLVLVVTFFLPETKGKQLH
ncbi:MFS transporter [Pseudomonas protegens]|jgi:MFS family permease|uniref:Transporter, major facilitator family n=4 Tax=Pseudomonas TaxID=286 RepID=Q4KAS4_PSEF5|nr:MULTISPECIES: MFS transporter [Pseudomonas]GED79137.1 sugar transporter [Pseudomonas fluorescens]AAY92823.1 transporter, major facilitator family [Pseudomonas protegens Pf-5]AGL85366.1 putative 4-methylmuconolactone transporter MmlH [Pseudomonas protegens CHA0]APC21498.1 MFS transporter [Pseudomonas protegens]AQT10525.1 major facilitator family transporter [Pseudomonas protegens]